MLVLQSVPCCWFNTACWFYSSIFVQYILGCGEFQHPCDIAVDYKRDDRLIVTDFNNNRVQVRVRAISTIGLVLELCNDCLSFSLAYLNFI